jgi:hypothetical protein
MPPWSRMVRTEESASCRKDESMPPLAYLVSELRLLASPEIVSVTVKVERSQIRVSHNLANLARLDLSTAFWLARDLMLFFRSWSRTAV